MDDPAISSTKAFSFREKQKKHVHENPFNEFSYREWAKSTLRKEKPEGAYTYDNLKKCITPYFSDNNVTQLFHDTLDSVFKLTPLLPDQAWECLLGLVMESHMLKNPLSHQQEALLDFLSIYISLEPDCDTAVKNFMLHYPRCEKCFPLVKQQFLYKRSKR